MKLIKLFKTNRTFRTFIEALIGYIIGNAAAAVTYMNSENWWKALLINLIIPAVATAYSEIFKNSYQGGEE